MDVKNVIEEYRLDVRERVRTEDGIKVETAYHVCRRPTGSEMKAFQKKGSKIRGTKITPTPEIALDFIWGVCFLRAEAYKGGPPITKSREEQVKWFRSNELGKNHIQRIAAKLVSIVQEDSAIDEDL